MGEYFALADRIADKAEKMQRIEALWRKQEAQALTVIALCANAEENGENETGFIGAFDRICALLETEPQMQSPMIETAVRQVMGNAKIPAIRNRAGRCRLHADWAIAADDRKNYTKRATHDNWIAEDNERHAQARRADIAAAARFLDSAEENERVYAANWLLKLSADPVSAKRIREIFAASAANEARDALEKLPALQAAAAVEIAAMIGKPAVIPRPYRNISR